MPTDYNFFNGGDWAKMQQQYIDAVSAFYAGTGNTSQKPLNTGSWNDAMDYWWKSVAGRLPDANKNVFESIVGQSRVFYSISEQFTNLLSDITNSPEGSDNWQGILYDHLDNMKSLFDQYQNQMNVSSVPPAMMWTSPIDMWQQAMSSILPDDKMERLLKVPAVGLTKDLQEKTQKTILLWNEYQQCSQRYNMAFAMLGKKALDRLGEKIVETAKLERKITTLKEIYNMWIDANEEVFADYARTEEYSVLYAGLVNSLVKFKSHYNDLTDEALKSFNIPTSEGVGTIAKQQHEIKKELRTSRENQQKLAWMLNKIQSDIEKIKTDNRPAGTKTTSNTKTARKKKPQQVKSKSTTGKSRPEKTRGKKRPS